MLRKAKKAYLLFVGFFFINGFANSQNQDKADSLIHVLEVRKNISDSLKLEILQDICANHSNTTLKLLYAKKAFSIAKNIGSNLWMSRSALEIGHAYKKKGVLERAVDAFYNSLEYAKEINYRKGEALAYSAIGSVYRVQKNHSIALTYYNLSIAKLRVLGDSTNLAISLMNTGELYRTNHILDTALLYFNESGTILNLKNLKTIQAYNLGNIGLVYAEQGKHTLAEKNIVEATKILQELGDNYPIAVYNTYMADIYKAKGDLPRALEYAQHSYSLAMADGLKEQIRDASHTLSELHEAQEEFKKAYHFQEVYLAYRDSINNEETIRKMADLRTEYEVSQKQIEVDLLNQEKKASRLIGAGLLSLLMAIAGLAFIYIRRNKEKRLTNKLLTEQKQQLQTQHNELEVLNATKDRFFSIISHDLRGPVSSFKGLTTIMKMSLEDKKYEELPKMTDMLGKASSQISTLLDNLLDWAVNQQGEFPYSPKKTRLANLVEDVLQASKSQAEAKQIGITTLIPNDVIGWVDKNSVETIIRNLVNNALKFTPKGGNIEIIGATEENEVVLKIKDTGVGISKKKFNTLFSVNELKSTPGTDGEKGLGLGLRLAYEFVRMNKGTILAESEEGKGTVFTVRFPALKNMKLP